MISCKICDDVEYCWIWICLYDWNIYGVMEIGMFIICIFYNDN